MKKLLLFIAASPLFCPVFGQQKLVFCKLKNSAREAVFELPIECTMQTTDGVLHRGTIYRIADDSLICFRGNYYAYNDSNYLNSKEYQRKGWKMEDLRDSIYADSTMNKMQKQKKYVEFTLNHPELFLDSFTVAFNEVGVIRIGFQGGVKQQNRKLAGGVLIWLTTIVFGAKMIRWDLEDDDKTDGYYKTWIGMGLMTGGAIYLFRTAYYTIRPEAWKLKGVR